MMITVGPNGELQDYETDARKQTVSTGNEDQMLREFDHLAKMLRANSRNYSRIALIVHGGLVSNKNAETESIAIAKAIKSDNSNPHYSSEGKIFPVFLNWDTSLGSSYQRSLTTDYAGISSRTPNVGPVAPTFLYTGPAQLIGDLGSGLSRIPENLVNSYFRFFKSYALNLQAHQLDATRNPISDHRTKELFDFFDSVYPDGKRYNQIMSGIDGYAADPKGFHSRAFDQTDNPFGCHFSIGQSKVRHSEREITNILWTPAKFITAPLADSVGPAAWGNMKRRARQLALKPLRGPLDAQSPNPGEMLGLGYKILRELDQICRANTISLELYGHSMGCIVINELVAATQMRGLGPAPRVKRVVYMAAACSIDDFLNSTGKLITKQNTEFHNLTLHPTQEIREVLLDDLGSPIVSGTLLIWIDEMFERPVAFEGRTLGSLTNSVVVNNLLPQGHKVSLKAFGAEFQKGKMFRRAKRSPMGPQKHGEFNNYHFWRSEFYRAASNPNQRYQIIDCTSQASGFNGVP